MKRRRHAGIAMHITEVIVNKKKLYIPNWTVFAVICAIVASTGNVSRGMQHIFPPRYHGIGTVSLLLNSWYIDRMLRKGRIPRHRHGHRR